jgi:hypothetical protein
MGLGFLAPLFLAGLAALAIPILVHLTHKERKEPIVFPSLMFLQLIPFRTQRRQRIRNWLLFALRALVVALLVVAFARPFLRTPREPGAGSRTARVILLDRSASMGARGRWERAVAAAREEVASLPRGARMALVAFDDRAEALTELTDDRAALTEALERVRPGSGAGRYAPALQVAASLIERGGGVGDVVLVSDFQRGGFDGATSARLPAGIALRTVDVGDTTLVNASVVDVVLDRENAPSGPRTTVSARLAAARGAARDVPVVLEIEGRRVQTVRARLVPGGATVARFAALRDPESARRARVVIPTDDQHADDAWHLVLGPAPRLAVLLLSRADAAGGDALYLRQALIVASDPAFPVSQRPAGSVRAQDLTAASVVILHDAPWPGGDAGRRLLDWVRAGGGLFVALGAHGSLPRELADSVGAGSEVVERAESGASIAVADASHPLFAGWGRADLGASRAWRYRHLAKATSVLARYDDGAPALVEARLGAGRVLIWTADFANRWSDLPLSPAFVPLIHGAVRQLARFTPPPESRSVGEVVELDPTPSATIVVEEPGGKHQALRAGTPARLVLAERGFYSVRRADQRGGESVLATNVPPAEFDPARVVPEQVARALAADSAAPRVARAGIADWSDRERGQRVWWYILAAVLVLFAVESGVAHRMRGQR